MVTVQVKMTLFSSLVRLEWMTKKSETMSQKKFFHQRGEKSPTSQEQRGWESPTLRLFNHRVG